MSNWRNIEIGKVIDFNPSESIKKGTIAKKIPMDKLRVFEKKIKGFEFSEFSAGPKFRNGDTLVAKITPCLENGKTAQVDLLEENEVAFGSSEFIVLRENENTINDYIFYLAKSPAFRKRAISCMEGTSGRKRVNEGALKLQVLPIPDKITQHKIAKVLSDLDAKIELNSKINTELEAIAKTLYDYWFVQFNFPNANGKPYKSSGGKMVWNEELKREIPESWQIGRLNQICDIVNGFAFKSEWYQDEGIKIIRTKNFDNGYIDLNDLVFIDKNLSENFKKYYLKTFDFLMVMVGASTGKHCIVNSNILPALQNQNMWRFVSKINKNQLFLNLKLVRTVLELENTTNGSARGFFQKDSFLNKSIEIPDSNIIDMFCDQISNTFYKIDNNLKENQELASLRDWLLPMLMNGQVKVADAEEIINDQLGMVAETSVEYQLNLTDKDKKIRRKMLATYIINQSLKDTSFGKTKFEKLLHLIECHIVKGDYNQRYSVQAAGPYDGGFTKVFWNEVTKAKWFKIEEFGKLKRIMPAENHAKSLVDYGYLSDDLKLMINDFIGKFKNTNYERPEIVSTLYAVWNNRIVRNEMITDELLKKDFLEWDTQKARYKDRLDKALVWMRENAIIPDGWGSEIRRAKK